MDTYLLGIKATEQKLVDYLHIYKRCNYEEEREEVQYQIYKCEQLIEWYRQQASAASAASAAVLKEFLPK